ALYPRACPLGARRHHPRYRHEARRTGGPHGARDFDSARAAVSCRRAVLYWHGGRDHADPLRGSHPGGLRASRSDHRTAAAGVFWTVLRQHRRQLALAGFRRHAAPGAHSDGVRTIMKTMYQKIWEQHEVVPESADTPAVLYIDRHLIHEVTTPQAFTQLRARNLRLRRPELTFATIDHSSPTRTEQIFGGAPIAIESAARQIGQLERNCAEFGVQLLGLKDPQRGIVHVIGPELRLTLPGCTLVCGDSHTSTHGALGALAFGIGTTEVAHVFATQCLLQRRARTLAIQVSGTLAEGVTAKDLILAIISRIGVAGGTGHVIEYRGSAVTALGM